MQRWNWVRILGLMASVGCVFLFVVVCRTCTNSPKPPALQLTFSEADSAYCELVDMRGRAQIELRRNNDISYRSKMAFRNEYPDKNLGVPMKDRFAIFADFPSQVSPANPVPPLLSAPKLLMRQSPEQLFPVFLLRPEENELDQSMHLVRIAFLKYAELDHIVEGDSFSYSKLQQKYKIQDVREHPCWKLFSQNHLFEYFDAYKTR